jgi:hypothetical protein
MNRRPSRIRSSDLPLWRRWFALLLGLLFLLIAPVLAYGQGSGADSVSLTWTAPGDDGSIGTATLYDMRVSTSTITLANWNSATAVAGLPAPLANGTRQTVIVRSLTRGTTYYFAIRTQDDAGNWSGISNLVRWDWQIDTAPPSAPNGLSAALQTPNVRVQWSANSEPDLQGYSVYRAIASGGPYVRMNGSLLATTQYVDNSVPNGATSLWYRVTATDFSGNESAQSAAARVDFASGGGVGGDWTMSPGYPNPSRNGQSVCIPLVIPIAGAGDATIEVVDQGGHRVRRFEVGTAATCAEGVVWDGRNDSGREVAPGVYDAWLIAGDHREHVRLVRQP